MVARKLDRRRRERLVVVGNGMVSVRLLEELIRQAPRRFDVRVLGAEPAPAYNRVLLSSVLAGESGADEVELKPRSWYVETGVRLTCGTRVTALRPARHEIVLDDGGRLAYDRLVLATGSEPVRLPVSGAHLRNVMTFRTQSDVAAMEAFGNGQKAVVIGGGLLGLEAACGLASRGLEVTVVHLAPRLMERQLDDAAAAVLGRAIAAKGIRVLLAAQTRAIQGGKAVERVLLADGTALQADLVVMAAGVRPATALAECAGLDVGRGIKVNDQLETNWPGVYAIGECTEHRGQCYGLVEPGYEQAGVLARYLAGVPARYEGSAIYTSLKVSGVPVFSMGDFEGVGAETIVLDDASHGIYRKLVIRDGRLVGAVLVGDTLDALWYRDLLRMPCEIPDRSVLALGKAFVEAA